MFQADTDEDEVTKPGIVVGETMIPIASVQEIAADAILLLEEEEEPFVFVEEVTTPNSCVRPTYDQIFRRIFHGED